MQWGLGELDLFIGDVWELATQAFVTPIHSELRPATQMALDLWRRAGPELEREFDNLDHLPLGHIFVTGAGTLDCENLIHIAASTLSHRPTIEAFEESLGRALMSAYHNTYRSIAVPAMFIDPGELTTQVVSKIIVRTSMEHLTKARYPGRIVLVVPTDYVHKVFLSEIERVRYGEPLS